MKIGREHKTHVHKWGGEEDCCCHARTFSTGDVVWVVVRTTPRIAVVLDPFLKAGENSRVHGMWLGNVLVLEGLNIKTYHARWLEH